MMLTSLIVVAQLTGAAPPEAVLLSNPTEEAAAPAVSPDGDEAAWEVVVPDGRELRRYSLKKKRFLTPPTSEAPLRSFGWTGNAKKPLVAAYDNDDRWSVRIGGKEPASPSAASDLHPTVSADGKWVAFVSGRSGAGDVYVTSATKTNQSPRRLSSSPLPELRPRWSPDSSQLAFIRMTERGRQLVVLSGVNGTAAAQERVAADEREGVLGISWRPDGKQLAFYGRDWSVGTAVYTVDPGLGGGSKVLSDVAPQPDGPAWVPDGKGGWLMVVVQKDQLVGIDAMGTQNVFETGTFGHGTVAGGSLTGRGVLVFTALGRVGDNKNDARYRKVYSWTVPMGAKSKDDGGMPDFR